MILRDEDEQFTTEDAGTSDNEREKNDGNIIILVLTIIDTDILTTL